MSIDSETITLRDGRSVRLGPVRVDDAENYRAYMVTLCGQTPWTGTVPSEVKDLDKQRERFEKASLRTSGEPGEWILGVFDPETGAVIGDCNWQCTAYERFGHVASLGIGILEDWHGVGLGRMLMERAIDAARADPLVHKIELGVFSTNTIARNLYDSLGFVTEGVRKNAIQPSPGTFQDDVIMGLWLGDSAPDKN